MLIKKEEMLGNLCEQSRLTIETVSQLLQKEDKIVRKETIRELSNVSKILYTLHEQLTEQVKPNEQYVCNQLTTAISFIPQVIKSVIRKNDFTNINIKQSVIQEIESLYKDLEFYRQKFFPKLETPLDPDPWNMAAVRLEQTQFTNSDWRKLDKNDPIRKFYKLLSMIKWIARSQSHPAHEIFFCNAWPNNGFPDEKWVPGFLKTLSDHLQCAGFNTILDQDESLSGGNPQVFMEKLNFSRYVFYFGTRTMKDKVLNDTIAMVLKEIEMIKSRRVKNADDNTVIPHLLSGDFRDAIHMEFLNSYAIINIGNLGYLDYLRSVIKRLYVGTDCWNNYDKLWDLFTSQSWDEFGRFCNKLKETTTLPVSPISDIKPKNMKFFSPNSQAESMALSANPQSQPMNYSNGSRHLVPPSPQVESGESNTANVSEPSKTGSVISITSQQLQATKHEDPKTQFKFTMFKNNKEGTLDIGTVKAYVELPVKDLPKGTTTECTIVDNSGKIKFEGSSEFIVIGL